MLTEALKDAQVSEDVFVVRTCIALKSSWNKQNKQTKTNNRKEKEVILKGTGRFSHRRYGNCATLRAENKDGIMSCYENDTVWRDKENWHFVKQ